MTITKMISPQTAIQRLKRFCKDKNYTVSSRDPEAREFADRILTCTNVVQQEPADRYTVYATYNNADTIKAEGCLLEMMYDLDLLAENEVLKCGTIDINRNDFIHRRSQVRQPWSRSAD